MKFINNYSNAFKLADQFIDILLTKQLKDKVAWQNFNDVFRTHHDSEDDRWRGEYFGKLMRGACLVYQYRKDEELYEIITNTVKDLLLTQDELGRFSTYVVEKEFTFWDIWSRKYVIVGMLYYYEICRDEKLKEQIIAALRKHIDYMIDKIGVGKLDICNTSWWWEGLNSSTLIEPVMHFYNIVKDKKYLDFAGYIAERGGTLTQNIVKLAYGNLVMPYEYKSTKAYEMMSFFEGVYEYALVTGNEYYKTAVENFVDAVSKTDLTIIGSCGCTHELFDHSAVAQTQEQTIIAQETCVTVTWIRLNTKLLKVTNNVKYYENIESSFVNALFGALNTENQEQYTPEEHRKVEPNIIDSYSPLCNFHRGIGIGGFNRFKDGTYFGCCIAIAAAGFGLFPLTNVMEENDSIVINNYFEGKILNGDIEISDGYLTGDTVVLSVKKDGKYNLKLRNPEWSKHTLLTINGKAQELKFGYNLVNQEFKEGDQLVIKFDKEVKKVEINGKVAFVYSPIVLAYDYKKSQNLSPVDLRIKEKNIVERVEPVKDEDVRFLIDGNVFSNYSSCGKFYYDEYNMMTVWCKKE